MNEKEVKIKDSSLLDRIIAKQLEIEHKMKEMYSLANDLWDELPYGYELNVSDEGIEFENGLVIKFSKDYDDGCIVEVAPNNDAEENYFVSVYEIEGSYCHLVDTVARAIKGK